MPAWEIMQNISVAQTIKRYAADLIMVLLLLTVVGGWYFNIFHNDIWFLRAGLFFGLSLLLVWRLCVHIQKPWVRGIVAVILVELLATYAAARLVSFYYQGESFNEEFFFHFSSQTMGFALGAFPGFVTLFFIYVLVIGVCAWLSVYAMKGRAFDNRTVLILPGLALVLAMDPDLFRLANLSMQDANLNRGLQLSTIDFDATGLNRNAIYKMSDDIVAGKNVVMIYLEGMERLYSDEAVYPDLTPFLNSLKGNALQFENIHQTRGATFTVAGILSSQCGTPLLFPSGPGGNDVLKNGFLQEGFCFGDILNAAGYRNVFMGGASTRFAGKGTFLSAHGYEEVLGLEELRPLMDDPGYLNNWGLYDDTLLELAKGKFDELAANPEQPFNFTVLTVDTHPPDGTVSQSCTPYPSIDNNIFHAVHCTDQLIEKFVTHIQQSPVWDNTVVLMMSDHLHMRNTGMEYYPEEYDRRLFVNILNAGISDIIETPGTHMDVAPTLLNLMGVQHQQAFLVGADLLAPETATRADPDVSGRREAAIRYINTSLLSRIEVGLCEVKPLYSFADETLRVAGREIELSLGGRPLDLNTIGTSHAMMTLVSKEGKVGLTFPVNLDNLAHVMYQFRTSNFLLLTPSAKMQPLDPRIGSYQGMGLLFGNLENSFDVLQTGISLDAGFEMNADCGDLLSKAEELSDLDSIETLGKICNYTVPDGTEWAESEGRIRLGSVAYADQRYQAELMRDSKGWYSVTNLAPIPIADARLSQSLCHAYYGNQEILIPGIMTEDGPSSMILNKIPGITLTFELGTVTPLPEQD